jgi:F-type H+-transporting ATPase subunit c
MNFILFFTHYGHYAGAFLAIALSALGAAIGQGSSFKGTEEAISRQTESAKAVKQLQFIGLLLIEGGPALGLIFVMIFLFKNNALITLPVAIVEASIGLAFGISALFSGIAAGQAVSAATEATSRQPFIAKKLSTFMLLMESFAEISLIFSFILGILIHTKISPTLTLPEAIKFSAAALTLSIATIGAGIAQGMLAKTNILAVGLNQNMYGKILTFTFITSAFIETPIFFAFFIALKLLYTPLDATTTAIAALGYFGATLASGLGSAGPSIGAAHVSGQSILQATLDPKQYESLRKTTVFIQLLLETGAIYSLLISLIISTII